jgi:hypothetical protein
MPESATIRRCRELFWSLHFGASDVELTHPQDVAISAHHDFGWHAASSRGVLALGGQNATPTQQGAQWHE